MRWLKLLRFAVSRVALGDTACLQFQLIDEQATIRSSASSAIHRIKRVSPASFILHERQCRAWSLKRKANSGSVESLASTLVDGQMDLKPDPFIVIVPVNPRKQVGLLDGDVA